MKMSELYNLSVAVATLAQSRLQSKVAYRILKLQHRLKPIVTAFEEIRNRIIREITPSGQIAPGTKELSEFISKINEIDEEIEFKISGPETFTLDEIEGARLSALELEIMEDVGLIKVKEDK